MTGPVSPVEAITRHIKHVPELNFTIVAEPHDYYVTYTIYDIQGYSEGETKGVFDTPCWPRAGAMSSPDSVDTLEESEPYLHGDVKWDGCSNWEFDEQERAMLHGCSRGDVQRFGDVMAMCWDWTKELCPNWIDL